MLWPGTLVTAELTLRIEEAVVVPSTAVQVSQTGSFVFVVKDGVAKVQPVKVERTVGSRIGDRQRARAAARPWSPTVNCCCRTARASNPRSAKPPAA